MATKKEGGKRGADFSFLFSASRSRRRSDGFWECKMRLLFSFRLLPSDVLFRPPAAGTEIGEERKGVGGGEREKIKE